MSTEKLRVGIVGCGMATMVMYTPVLRHVERAEITALCEPYPAALERARSYFPAAEAYADYDDFLARAAIDALIVATPTQMHRDQVVKAARAGKHVMCEKPMARTLAECDEMIAACEAAGVTLMIGFMKRFDKSMIHAKRLIDEGRLGTPFGVLCDWRGQQPSMMQQQRPAPDQRSAPNQLPALDQQAPLGRAIRDRAFSWRGGMDTLGGVYQDVGSHTTDLARWWLGDITTVSGEFSVLRPGREVDDIGIGVYVHQGGAKSVHLLGHSNKQSREIYQIDGSRATLEIDYGPSSFSSADPFRMQLFEQGGEIVRDETRYNDIILDEELRTAGRYKVELDHFCESVLTGTSPITSGLDGRKTIEAINAVYLSAYLGEKVRLPLETTPDLEQIFADVRERSPRFT